MSWLKKLIYVLINLCCIITKYGDCQNASEFILHSCLDPLNNSTLLHLEQYEMPSLLMHNNISTRVRFKPLMLKCEYTKRVTFPLFEESENENKSKLEVESMKRPNTIRFGPGGVLQYGSHYFWNTEFCINDITKSVISLQICHVVCEAEDTVCVHKCCPLGKALHGSQCVASGVEAELWRPTVYHAHSAQECLEQFDTGESCVDGEIPKENFHYVRFNPVCQMFAGHTPYYSDQESFGLLKNGTLLVYDKRLNRFEYCLDEAVDEFGNKTEVLLTCGCPEPPENESVSILYIVGMFISSFFLLMTILVYVLIWSIHNIHGWTVFSLSVSMFFMLVYLGTSRSMQLTMHRDDVADSTVCFFVGFTTHFFFLSTFCWLTMLSFDLWWTFRSLSPVTGRSKGLERFLYYALFAIGLPILVVSIGITLDKFSNSEDVTSPAYGTESCFIGDAKSFRYWVIVPVGVLLFFNLLFFGTTMFKMYTYQKNAAAVRANSNNQRQTALLFAKLFLVMGVTWIFEIIENLSTLDQVTKDERGCDVHHTGGESWIVTDLINLFQGIAIFLIFVCKRQILVHLWRKQEMLRVCINPLFRIPCCRSAQLELERSVSGTKTCHSTLSMRQLSTQRSVSASENL